MKFIMAYSGGKDCTLSLEKMLKKGHQCVCLLVSVGVGLDYSFMHLLTKKHFENVGEAVGIPVHFVEMREKYDEEPFVKELKRLKKLYNAEALCTGEISIPEVKDWMEQLARAADMECVFPLWDIDRWECVNYIIDNYKCYIKAIDETILPMELLGHRFDKEAVDMIEKAGAGICGEDGGYHTVVTYAPIFSKEVPFHYDSYFHGKENTCYIINSEME